MIHTSNSFRFIRFNDVYTSFFLNRKFDKIVYPFRIPEKVNKPILFIGNAHHTLDLEIAYHLNKKIWGKEFHAIIDSKRYNEVYSLNKLIRIGFNERAIEPTQIHHFLLGLLHTQTPIISIFLKETQSLSSETRYQVDAKLIELVKSSIILDFEIYFFATITKRTNKLKDELHLFTTSTYGVENPEILEDQYNIFLQECLTKGGFFA